MKLFSLVLSVLTFFVSLYFFVLKIPEVNTFDEVIYITLLIILMAICITGVIINWGLIKKQRSNRVILFVSSTLSSKKNL
jgi:predicted membrane channel-forming protein YqfA (hemolysin III family)